MLPSKDPKVQEFLDKIKQDDISKCNALETLREIVFKIHPETTERMMYGGIMFTAKNEDFGGIFVRKNHISFEFGNGIAFDDPNKLLEGTGKQRRHLKIKPDVNILNYDVEFFVNQAIRGL
jgi:hypothetical protein